MEFNNVESPVPTSEPDPEIITRAIIKSLYKALSQGDASTVAKLVACDLEWWFHGPPQCQHMMRLLTGEPLRQVGFRFEPRSIKVIGECAIAEGWEGSQVYWVHVWKLRDGLVVELREYFNTWLTVTNCGSRPLWESMPRDSAPRSLPGLLLAI